MKREKVPQADDIKYREYLLEIIDRFAEEEFTGEFQPDLSNKEIRELTIQNLRKKLKQDFSTNDNSIISPDIILLEVTDTALNEDYEISSLKRLIRNEHPNWSNRQILNFIFENPSYLERWRKLNISRGNFGKKYHINFFRSDLEQTTHVRENILTLQSYLRDEKCSSYRERYFGDEPNPFFFYKQEWRSRTPSPNYGELTVPFFDAFNLLNYNFKRGLFATNKDRQHANKLYKTVKNHDKCSSRGRQFVHRIEKLLELDKELTEGQRNFYYQNYNLAKKNYTNVEQCVQYLTNKMGIYVWGISPDGNDIEGPKSRKPDLSSAEDFCSSLDPSNWKDFQRGDYYLFSSRPSWDHPLVAQPPGWHSWRTEDGREIEGTWKTALKKGWWDPIDNTPWDPIAMDISVKKLPSKFPYTSYLFERLYWRYHGRAQEKINSFEDLDKLISRNVVKVAQLSSNSYEKLEVALFKLHDDLISLVPHVMFFMLPLCQGDLETTMGNFPSAANYYAQIVRESLLRASVTSMKVSPMGDLPWGWFNRSWKSPSDSEGNRELNGRNYPYLNQSAEDPIIRLRLGNLYLNWAEYLYREDQEAKVYRARELYKAILYLYDEDPLLPNITNTIGNFAGMILKSVIKTQKIRARIGIDQINNKLNYYGYPHDLVPSSRYHVLIQDAEKYVKLAKEKAKDYYNFKKEALNKDIKLIEQFKISEVTDLLLKIASKRENQANNTQYTAQNRVKLIQNLITAKKKKIADSNSFCGQVEDYFSGIKNFFTKAVGVLPEEAMNAIKDDYGILKSDIKAAFGFKSGTASGGSGFGFFGGMALFTVGTSYTLSGMSDTANKQLSELRQLEEQLLLSQVDLDTSQREVKITQLQKKIVELEIQTTKKILEYKVFQEFNSEVCYSIASTKKNLLRDYLDLGSKYLWLARQALIFEQGLDEDEIPEIPFSSFYNSPIKGPDLLEKELNNLMNKYRELQQCLESTPRPIRSFTVSLARDFPLEFAQLKEQGRCNFMTNTEFLNQAYPGHFSYRIRSVKVSCSGMVPPIGYLKNLGISHIEREDIGIWDTLKSSPDVLTLSRSFNDNGVVLSEEYPLDKNPYGEIRKHFEGTGLNTLWELNFPALVNPTGLDQLSDIYITFELKAHYSTARMISQEELSAKSPPTQTRTILFSAKAMFPDLLKAFVKDEGDGKLEFNITEDLMPFAATEQNRQVSNIAIYFLGENLPEIKGTLRSQTASNPVQFTTEGGLSHSNNIPQPAAEVLQVPSSPLDLLAIGSPVQTWTLNISNSNTRSKISNVLLGIEYIAKIGFDLKL